MTPLELEILLHYYCKARDYRDGDFSFPAVREAIESFVRYEKLLVSTPCSDSAYVITDRGKFYVDHLLNQPLPKQVWVIPEGE